MMIRCLYLGEDRWRMLTSGGKEFKARNRSGRQPSVNHTYTVQVFEKITHDAGKTRSRFIVAYLA